MFGSSMRTWAGILLAGTALAMPGLAVAQIAPAAAATQNLTAPTKSDPTPDIVVTGSRLLRSDLDARTATTATRF